MHKQILSLGLLALALAATGCGSDTTTAPTAGSGVVPPTSFQPTNPVTQGRTLDGIWQGTLRGSQGVVFLTLSQTGTAVEGDGALFVNNQPTAVEVSGNLAPDGQAILDLVTHDDNATGDGAQITLALTSSGQADANLSNVTTPSGADFTLTRSTTSALKLWDGQPVAEGTRFEENYQVLAARRSGPGAYNLLVSLDGTRGGEFSGRWTLGESSLPMLFGAQEGRVLAGNADGGRFSYLTFFDSEYETSYGTVWFPRTAEGPAGSTTRIQDTSRLNGQQLLGAVTLVRP